MKTTVATATKTIRRHKVAIAVTVTAATCLTLNRIALKQHVDFLKENDLFDKFLALGSE